MSNRISYYKKEHGSYYYYDYQGNMLFMSDYISLLYDPIEGVLFKHGNPDYVQKHYEEYKKMQSINPDLFNFKVVTSNKWDVTELNRILDTSSYIKLLETDPQRFEESQIQGVINETVFF